MFPPPPVRFQYSVMNWARVRARVAVRVCSPPIALLQAKKISCCFDTNMNYLHNYECFEYKHIVSKKNKTIGASGARQFSPGTHVGGRPGTTIFQNRGGGGGGGWGLSRTRTGATPPPRGPTIPRFSPRQLEVDSQTPCAATRGWQFHSEKRRRVACTVSGPKKNRTRLNISLQIGPTIPKVLACSLCELPIWPHMTKPWAAFRRIL